MEALPAANEEPTIDDGTYERNDESLSRLSSPRSLRQNICTTNSSPHRNSQSTFESRKETSSESSVALTSSIPLSLNKREEALLYSTMLSRKVAQSTSYSPSWNAHLPWHTNSIRYNAHPCTGLLPRMIQPFSYT